jgi:hypothetical protein
MANLPQLFMDTAQLSQIQNVLEQDIPLVGDAVSSSFTAVYCTVILATSLGLLFTINSFSACRRARAAMRSSVGDSRERRAQWRLC